MLISLLQKKVQKQKKITGKFSNKEKMDYISDSKRHDTKNLSIDINKMSI